MNHFRFNRRTSDMLKVFSDAVLKVSGSSKLPYKTLKQKPA
jgi:hypothetical protein